MTPQHFFEDEEWYTAWCTLQALLIKNVEDEHEVERAKDLIWKLIAADRANCISLINEQT